MTGDASFAVHEPQFVDRVDEPIDRAEVLRYLGYPAGVAPRDQLQVLLDQWVAEAYRLASPRATYVILPVVEIQLRKLRLQASSGVIEFHGAVGEFLGPSRFVAPFIATAGPNIERLASRLMSDQDEMAAVIVNAVGAERAEAAESVVIDNLRAQGLPSGLVPTLPYSPGYCGMALSEQRKLFAVFDGGNIGVTLTDDFLMRPLKSISGLIGLGLSSEVETAGSPCDRCEIYNCNMRR